MFLLWIIVCHYISYIVSVVYQIIYNTYQYVHLSMFIQQQCQSPCNCKHRSSPTNKWFLQFFAQSQETFHEEKHGKTRLLTFNSAVSSEVSHLLHDLRITAGFSGSTIVCGLGFLGLVGLGALESPSSG